MPIPLILAALQAAGGAGGVLSGLGSAGGLSGAGALSSLAGPQSFLGPFGAQGFLGTAAQSGLPGIFAQNQAFENQGLMDLFKQSLAGGGGGQGVMMPLTKRKQVSVNLGNQRTRRG